MLRRIKKFIDRTKALKESNVIHNDMLRIAYEIVESDDLTLMRDWNALMKDIEDFEYEQYVKLTDGVWMVKF